MLSKYLLRIIPLLLLLHPGAAVFAVEEGATLNLKNSDIRVLIDTVSEITGKNFIIDPRVKAKVTVVSAHPMQPDEIYRIFLSILQVHGFSAVPTGNVIKIVPDVNAKQGPVPTISDDRPTYDDQLVTRVVHISHVPAAQLVPILRPLIPQQGQLAAYQPSNILLISDRSANVNRLVEIIRRIDRPDQSDIELVPLSFAPATDVAKTLATLQRKDAKGAAMPGQPVITADERTNSILISGDKATRTRLRGIISRLDTETDAGGDTQVVFLKFARAEDLVKILTGVSKSSSGATSSTAGRSIKGGKNTRAPSSVGSRKDVSIQADEANNALVITAAPAVQQELRQVIAQLDVRREQVLVEAIIAEVTLDLAKELGVGLAVTETDSSGNVTGPALVTNLGNLTNTILGAINNPTAVPAGFLLGGGNLDKGGTNFGAVLRALASDTANNILSTPTLVTMDNKEAEIQVGQEVPFLTGQFSNTGGNNGSVNPFQTIERKTVGLTLKVKPQISEGNIINLEIDQESSGLAAAAAGAEVTTAVTKKRTIKTNVLAEDGQVIVLGGLIDDQYSDSQQKVPILGDIPILGHLFRHNTTSKAKQSLMVFIRPVILRDNKTTTAFTEKKYDHFRERQQATGIQDRGLIKDEAAVIPDLEDLVTQVPTGSAFIEQLPDTY